MKWYWAVVGFFIFMKATMEEIFFAEMIVQLGAYPVMAMHRPKTPG
jgi:hypothetical protein